MSRRDLIIGKLSDTMDLDNARALLDEVMREHEMDIIDDHSAALEFVRELARTPCGKWACSSHPDEGRCIRCRASIWLHATALLRGGRL